MLLLTQGRDVSPKLAEPTRSFSMRCAGVFPLEDAPGEASWRYHLGRGVDGHGVNGVSAAGEDCGGANDRDGSDSCNEVRTGGLRSWSSTGLPRSVWSTAGKLTLQIIVLVPILRRGGGVRRKRRSRRVPKLQPSSHLFHVGFDRTSADRSYFGQ